MSRNRLRGAALIGLLLWTNRARANPVDAFGAGLEGRAMAGARTALETSGASAYVNPAGLANATATRLDLALSDLGSSLTYRGASGASGAMGAGAGSESFAGAELAMVLPLPGLLRGGALGLYGLFPSDDLGRVVARDQSSPQFLQAGQIHRFALYGAVAYKIGPLSVGAGVQLLNSASGALQLNTDVAAATVGQRYLSIDLVPTVAPVVGLTVDALDLLRVGVSYRGAGDIEVQLPSNVQLGPLGITLALDALAYYRPPTWSLGVGFHHRFLQVDADFSYLQWSQAPEQGLAATVVTTSALLPTLATGPSGLKLSDTPIWRLGVRVPLPFQLAVLGGYAYQPTPVPTQLGSTNLLDNDRHTLAGGVSVGFADPLGLASGLTTFGLAGQYQAMGTRQMQKLDPLDLHGDASFGGSLFALTASLSLRFGATP